MRRAAFGFSGLGETLAALRKMKNMRQTDVASKIGVSKSTINRMERGKVAGITVERIALFATALGVSPNEILNWQRTESKRRGGGTEWILAFDPSLKPHLDADTRRGRKQNRAGS